MQGAIVVIDSTFATPINQQVSITGVSWAGKLLQCCATLLQYLG